MPHNLVRNVARKIVRNVARNVATNMTRILAYAKATDRQMNALMTPS
jgi:hypothetical protein